MESSSVLSTWLFTFTTYASWLHGDARGSVQFDWRTKVAVPLPPNPALLQHELRSLRDPPVTFDPEQRRVVRESIEQSCAFRGWNLLALNVLAQHVHSVCSAAAKPKRVLNDWKVYATRRLVERGLIPQGTAVWTRGGNIVALPSERVLRAACAYVLEGQGSSLCTARPDLGVING